MDEGGAVPRDARRARSEDARRPDRDAEQRPGKRGVLAQRLVEVRAKLKRGGGFRGRVEMVPRVYDWSVGGCFQLDYWGTTSDQSVERSDF
jgi:hypothetical protein